LTRFPETFPSILCQSAWPKIPGKQLPAKRPRYVERTGERPAMLCLFPAPMVGVKVRAPARQPRQWVGDKLAPGRHYAQQLGLGRTFPASHAGTQRSADMRQRGRSAICGQVYRVAESAASAIFPAVPASGAGGTAAGAGGTAAAGAVSGTMSIFHPVSRAASRAFWPSLPIASESW
jgi:hypothetical protein